MHDGIGSRVGRIISGTVNTLVEAMEQSAPEMVMEEVVREIDSAIQDVRVELGREVAGKHVATSRLAEQQQKYQDLSQKIEFAVKEGRDDLAEVAIAQQLDVEAQIPVLEHAIAEGSKREKELEGYVNALQAKKREMREDLRRYRESRVATGKTAHPVGGKATGGGVEAMVARAESTFDRVMEKATGVPGGVPTSDAKVAGQMAELERLARKNRIQERLAAVKGQAIQQ